MNLQKLIIILLLLICPLIAELEQLNKPNLYSEGKFYTDGDQIYCNAIVIKLKYDLFKTERGQETVDYRTLDNKSSLRKTLNTLDNNDNLIEIRKQIPERIWGDTITYNKRTGKIVKIVDNSQLFTLYFKVPVPLIGTLELLRNNPDIEYAHQPISIVTYEEPDDPEYKDN